MRRAKGAEALARVAPARWGVTVRRFLAISVAGVVLLVLLASMSTPAFAFMPDGTQGWFWQMPCPGGSQGLWAVSVPRANNIWAVGSGGVILRSADLGLTWSQQDTPTTCMLDSVCFVDASHGWAIGNLTVHNPGPGVVLGTSNGGLTWKDETPPNMHDDLLNVSFADAKHGWIGTELGGVWRTTDGGMTWHRVLVSKTLDWLTVDFVDATHGWAAGNQTNWIWRTVNGGAAWTRLNVGLSSEFTVETVRFVDRNHGWLLAGGLAQHGIDQEVLYTADGGYRWYRRWIGRQTNICDLVAGGANSVWMLVSNAPYVSLVLNAQAPTVTTALMHSTDAGHTWHTSRVACSLAPSALAISGSSLCAVGSGILTSSDGGTHWLAASSGIQYGFTAAQAVSASDVWAVSGVGAVLHSTDGAHWIEQAKPAPWAQTLAGISFPDANHGWLVGSGGSDAGGSGVILHTADGGITWTPQASSLAGDLTAVDFIDASTGWVGADYVPWGSGAAASVQHTTDGGSTWTPQYLPGNPSICSIDFLDASSGWAAGYLNVQGVGALYVTTNGGTQWTKVKLPAGTMMLQDVQFLDANDGWAAETDFTGGQGVLLHTTDGGASWTQTRGFGGSLAALHFVDDQHGWVAGNGVYATSDGGQTWQRVAAGDGVTALACADASHLWACGSGFLLSTVNAGGDTASPVTMTDLYNYWQRRSVTIHLMANDVGGSDVASTQFSTDGGATWKSGTQIAVAAPASHANDGDHEVLYRSTDNAGNVEPTEIASLGIDTLGPAVSAPAKATVNAGKTGIIRFTAKDATSGVAWVTVTINDRKGRELRKFVFRPGNWSWDPTPPYWWFRFTCTLKPGTYRIEVRAADFAGNRQIRIGYNWLKVVRRGAPAQKAPYWEQGLPDQAGTSAWRTRWGRLGSPRSARWAPLRPTAIWPQD